MVSVLGDTFYQFPPSIPLTKKLKDVLEENVSPSYYLKEEQMKGLILYDEEELRKMKDNDLDKIGSLENLRFESERRIYSPERLAPTVTTKYHVTKIAEFLNVKVDTKKGYDEAYENDGVNLSFINCVRRGRVQHEKSPTLTTKDGCGCGVVVCGNKCLKIRYLTPRECWRLMGFSDEAYDKASQVVSEHQLYMLAGNSIPVPLLTHIFLTLY